MPISPRIDPDRNHADFAGVPARRCARNYILDNIAARPYLSPVPLTEGVSGDEPESERDAASCGLARNQAPGRRPGNTTLPPLGAERANALRAPCEHRPPCNAQRSHRGGLGAKRSPRWSAERRASPARGLRKRFARDARRPLTPAGLRHWPAKGASQAPERLSALRFPRSCEGHWQKLGGRLPRENDEVCVVVARVEPQAR